MANIAGKLRCIGEREIWQVPAGALRIVGAVGFVAQSALLFRQRGRGAWR